MLVSQCAWLSWESALLPYILTHTPQKIMLDIFHYQADCSAWSPHSWSAVDVLWLADINDVVYDTYIRLHETLRHQILIEIANLNKI